MARVSSTPSPVARLVAASEKAAFDLVRARELLSGFVVGRAGCRRSLLCFEYLHARAYARHTLDLASSLQVRGRGLSVENAFSQLSMLQEQEGRLVRGGVLTPSTVRGLLADQYLERATRSVADPIAELARAKPLVRALLSDSEFLDIQNAVIERFSLTLVWHEGESLLGEAWLGTLDPDVDPVEQVIRIAAQRLRHADQDVIAMAPSPALAQARSGIFRASFHRTERGTSDFGPMLGTAELPWGGQPTRGLLF